MGLHNIMKRSSIINGTASIISAPFKRRNYNYKCPVQITPMQTDKVNIAIVDDHTLFRQGLSAPVNRI
jgi:hypothetical protein